MALQSRFDGPFARVQAVIGWAALALVLLSVIPLGGAQPIAWTLLAFGILGLLGLQIALSLFRPAAAALSHALWPAFFFGLAVIWCFVQNVVPAPATLSHPIWAVAPDGAVAHIGADPGAGAHIALRLATYAMIAWIFVASSLNSGRAWAFLKAIAIFTSLMAVYALWAMVNEVNPVLGITRFGPDYTTGTFVSRNSYAYYAAIGLFANVAIYLNLSGRGLEGGGNSFSALRAYLENFFRGAWLFVIGAALNGAALILTQSRAGTAAALIGLFVLAACVIRRQSKAQAAIWLVVLALLVYLGFAYGEGMMNRLMSFETAGGRFEIYAEMLPQIMERPLLGHGAGAFHETFRAHVPLSAAQAEWDYAHNTYLENAYEFGLPAAALFYLALVLVALRCMIGLWVRKADTPILALALAATAAGAAHSVIDFPLQMPGNAALLAALLGIGWAQSFRKDDRRSLPRPEVTNDI